MITLGIETTTSLLSIVIMRDGSVISSLEVNAGQSHSINIIDMIQKAFEWGSVKKSDVDLIAVDVGPGSFTSIRTGVSTARAMAQFGSVSIVSVTSLDVLYQNFVNLKESIGERISTQNVISMIDGRKKRVFASVYRNGKAIEENLDIDPLELMNQFKDNEEITVFIGNGAKLYRDIIVKEFQEKAIFLPDQYDFPHARFVAVLGRQKMLESGDEKYNDVLPNYIRKSDAELLKNK